MVIFDFLEQHIELITLILTVCGGIFALYQWRLSVKNDQAEYVDKLLDRFQNDEEIRTFVSMCDYLEEWYDDYFHDYKSEKCHAKKADKTLFFLNYLCHIEQERVLQKKEFEVFEYNIYAIIQNDNTLSYLADLYHYTIFEKRRYPFEYLLKYGIKKGIIPKEIVDRDYCKYILMIESGEDDVPEQFRELYKKIGSRRYLYAKSRCECCKNYSAENKTCQKNCSCEEHYWDLSGNLCPEFKFDPKKMGKV